jgi:energy-coupling factor transporter transmembrane protein EcfT
LFSQYVDHWQENRMNGYPPLLSVGRSFVSSLHPLLKVLIGIGLLTAFFIIPDQSLSLVAAKGGVLLLLWFETGGLARWKSLLRILFLLSGFLGILFLCTVLGKLMTDQGNLTFFREMVFKSFWTVTISFLISGTIHFRECIYLSRFLKIPQAVSTQVLLVILIWGKLFQEYFRVPLAWKSRGITSRYLRRHPVMIAGLLKVVLFRVTRQATRLELSLVSRGFTGRLYTCFSASWKPVDSLTLLGVMVMLFSLFFLSLGC